MEKRNKSLRETLKELFIPYFLKKYDVSEEMASLTKDKELESETYKLALIAIPVIVAMVFYLIYGSITNYFFDGTLQATYRFIAIMVMFIPSCLLDLFFLLNIKIKVSNYVQEGFNTIFSLCVISGIFLFYIADYYDPSISDTFSAGFIWFVILAFVPLSYFLPWILVSIYSITGTILVTLFFSSPESALYQYYLIVLLVVLLGVIMRSCYFIYSYYYVKTGLKVDEYHELSLTDPLTGIGNRRGFDSFLELKIPSWKRNEATISIIMFDIDHLKEYNDSYQHLEGDSLIKQIVELVYSICPNRNLNFFRFGGDEFVIVVVEKDLEKVKLQIKQVLDAIRAAKIKAPSTINSEYMTISIGGKSEVASPSYSALAQLKEADSLLYKVKNSSKGYAIFDDTIIK